MAIESCSEIVVGLATLGGAALYALIGLAIACIFKEMFNNATDDEMFIVGSVWPVSILVGIVALILRWALFPFYGATKGDLRETEERIRSDMEDYYSSVEDIDSFMATPRSSFKVGDVITGKVPQTDYDGNPISYKHLYQGCKCRVLSISDSGSMKVILIDHKDKEAHKSVIGKTFTVPARNFTLVKKTAAKRGPYKKKNKK